jgi:hypothetical protein
VVPAALAPLEPGDAVEVARGAGSGREAAEEVGGGAHAGSRDQDRAGVGGSER